MGISHALMRQDCAVLMHANPTLTPMNPGTTIQAAVA
jgi:hypothetical protein